MEAQILASLLKSSQELGFIGARSLVDHLAQAEAMIEIIARHNPGRIVDLGSGGGIPGLPIALAFPNCEVFLVESMQRRADFLDMAIDRLGLSSTVRLCHSPAEDSAHREALRYSAELVCARGFGPPSMTAEIALGFLKPKGRLLVTAVASDFSQKWPIEELMALGYVKVLLHDGPWPMVECVRGESEVAGDFPRRKGLPRKRPLFV